MDSYLFVLSNSWLATVNVMLIFSQPSVRLLTHGWLQTVSIGCNPPHWQAFVPFDAGAQQCQPEAMAQQTLLSCVGSRSRTRRCRRTHHRRPAVVHQVSPTPRTTRKPQRRHCTCQSAQARSAAQHSNLEAVQQQIDAAEVRRVLGHAVVRSIQDPVSITALK